jgi:hypothetical protein
MKRKQVEPKKPIHAIKLGRVRYRYVIGLSRIQIETDSETDWPEMPEYMKICFSITTPNTAWVTVYAQTYHHDEIEKVIIQAIKKKTNEQRKAHASSPGTNRPLGSSPDKQKQKAALPNPERKRRKPVAAVLPFESDTDSASGKTAV